MNHIWHDILLVNIGPIGPHMRVIKFFFQHFSTYEDWSDLGNSETLTVYLFSFAYPFTTQYL